MPADGQRAMITKTSCDVEGCTDSLKIQAVPTSREQVHACPNGSSDCDWLAVDIVLRSDLRHLPHVCGCSLQATQMLCHIVLSRGTSAECVMGMQAQCTCQCAITQTLDYAVYQGDAVGIDSNPACSLHLKQAWPHYITSMYCLLAAVSGNQRLCNCDVVQQRQRSNGLDDFASVACASSLCARRRNIARAELVVVSLVS
jgi:hypothetical protein